MLEVNNLQFTYDDKPLLRDISFSVAAGESLFIVGPSGAGKSSILRCLAGLETPEAGTIVLEGDDLEGTPTHERSIGMLMQEATLFPHLNAWQNVAFGVRYHGIPKQEERWVADGYLELVGLKGKVEAMPDELSGGQRQRVALARTLAAKPRAVLLDEPLSALERDLRGELGERIRDLLQEQGVPAVWVTHDEGEAARLGNQTMRLHEGVLAPVDPNPP